MDLTNYSDKQLYSMYTAHHTSTQSISRLIRKPKTIYEESCFCLSNCNPNITRKRSYARPSYIDRGNVDDDAISHIHAHQHTLLLYIPKNIVTVCIYIFRQTPDTVHAKKQMTAQTHVLINNRKTHTNKNKINIT